MRAVTRFHFSEGWFCCENKKQKARKECNHNRPVWQPPGIILVNINGRNKVALMYVASTYKSNDLLNWQFEREVDELINFNYNELDCPVFIICVSYTECFCLCLLLGSKNTQKQHIDDILLLFNSSYEQLEGESLRHLMVSFFPWMWI